MFLSGPRITIEIIVNRPLRVYHVYQHGPLAICEPRRIRLCCILMPLVIKYLLLSIAFVSYLVSNGRTVSRAKIATTNNDPGESRRLTANLALQILSCCPCHSFNVFFYMIFIFLNICTIIFRCLQCEIYVL